MIDLNATRHLTRVFTAGFLFNNSKKKQKLKGPRVFQAKII
jgi:hypothetical protein